MPIQSIKHLHNGCEKVKHNYRLVELLTRTLCAGRGCRSRVQVEGAGQVLQNIGVIVEDTYQAVAGSATNVDIGEQSVNDLQPLQ